MKNDQFETNCGLVRRKIVEIAFECNESAHIGGCLSMVETLITLYGQFLKHDPANPDWNKRDYFILSKGHCVFWMCLMKNEQNLFCFF